MANKKQLPAITHNGASMGEKKLGKFELGQLWAVWRPTAAQGAEEATRTPKTEPKRPLELQKPEPARPQEPQK